MPGECVSMLIDEEGRLKPNRANLIGSYLYEYDKHGCPILGNILFIGERWEIVVLISAGLVKRTSIV